VPCTQEGRKGEPRAIEAIGKREGLNKVEALVSRLYKASKVPEWPAEDQLDPEKGGDGRKEASLYTTGDSLLFYRATVGLGRHNVTVRALLDYGASHTFVSPAIVRKLGENVASQRSTTPLHVRMPDGGRLYTDMSVRIPITLGSWKGYLKAWILELPDLEFILGRDFLRSHNPRIDWTTSVMKLRDRSKTHQIEPLASTSGHDSGEGGLNLISARQVGRAMRKRGTESALFILREAKDVGKSVLPGHEDKKICRILEQFPDVFKDSLPEALPPERASAHRIDTGDAAPVNINSYPMSDEKLREQMEQVEMLLKKGLIRPSASA
jgi:hypothetical protein